MSIRTETVVLVTCDECGDELPDHFDEMVPDLDAYGWNTEGTDKAPLHYCEWCSDTRSCIAEGHKIARGRTSCDCGAMQREVVKTLDPTVAL